MRLNQKHSKNLYHDQRKLDADTIIAAQSLPRAAVAASAVIALMTLLAMMLASLFDRVFPWLVLFQGALIGLAIRRWGHGFDWRFAASGALLAFFGAYVGSFLIAASVAAEQLQSSTVSVILNMSEYTLGTYFAEDLNPADHIFAAFAAAFAAFFARRELSRDEYRAIRLMRQADTQEKHQV